MIIVLGSINIDMVFPVQHLPEPGETVAAASYEMHCGGKGANQAIAAARCETKTAMVGRVGDDIFGRRAQKNLKQHSVWAAGVGISDESQTGLAMIAVDPTGENEIIVAHGANADITADQVPDDILSPRNLVLADFEIPVAVLEDVLARAKKRNCLTILNAAPVVKFPKEMLQSVDVFIVNEIEAQQVSHQLDLGEQDPIKMACVLSKTYDLTVIITMGRQGAFAVQKGHAWKVAALDIEKCVDTTGAGDCFCGVFAAYTSRGEELPIALHRAAIAGSLSCQKLGAQESMPWYDDIEAQKDTVALPKKLS